MRLLPTPGTRPAPVAVGSRVHVPHAVGLPSGRRIPAGSYEALDVCWHERRQGWAVTIEAAPDCSKLAERYHRPTPEEREAGAEVPLASQRTRLILLPGDYTSFGAAPGPLTIPDR